MGLLNEKDIEDRTAEIPQEPDEMAQKYLDFRLNDEEYAVEVFKVKEIMKYIEVSEVPNTSLYLMGVISLRGVVIPVLDIKRCLGLSDSLPTRRLRIIVIKHGENVAGLPVDSVREVINVVPYKIKPFPQFMKEERVNFFKGVIEYMDRFIALLNIHTFLGFLKI